MRLNSIKTNMNLNRLTKTLLECGYCGVALPPDGLDTVRFDNKLKKTIRLFYITNHAKTDFVKPIRNLLMEREQSKLVIEDKKMAKLKMVTVNLLENWKGADDLRYVVAKDIHQYHSYYSVAYIPKEKSLCFYKPGFFSSRAIKQSYKEVLTLFGIKTSRKIFGLIKV